MPVAYAYVAVSPEKCVIFVDSRKVESVDLRKRWAKEGVEIRNYGLDKLVNWVREQGDKVKVMAPTESSYALVSKIGEVRSFIATLAADTAVACRAGIVSSRTSQGYQERNGVARLQECVLA